MKFVKNLILLTLLTTTGVYLSSAMEIHVYNEIDPYFLLINPDEGFRCGYSWQERKSMRDEEKAWEFAKKYFKTPEEQRPKDDELTRAFLGLNPSYPLQVATKYNLSHVVMHLITIGNADVNSKDHLGRTALHWAIISNEHGTNLVDMFLAFNGINADIPDQDGLTPLHWAAEKGNLHIVSRLLRAAPNINARDWCGKTPLYSAVYNEHSDVVTALLTAGADVRIANKQGVTPLHIASFSNRTDIAELLCASPNIDINAPNEDGETPLHYAVTDRRTKFTSVLLADPRIQVNIRNKAGQTPLKRSLSMYGNTSISDMLRAHGGIE